MRARLHHRSILRAALVALLLGLPCPSHAILRSIEGTVARVGDGDTITVMTPEGTKLKTRLYGIDAPETRHREKPGQPHGDEARLALKDKLAGKRVRLDIMDVDAHRRMIALVYLEDRNVNLEMVREGHAWAYRRYLRKPYAAPFLEAEREARRERRGLWREGHPIPPGKFKTMYW